MKKYIRTAEAISPKLGTRRTSEIEVVSTFSMVLRKRFATISPANITDK